MFVFQILWSRDRISFIPSVLWYPVNSDTTRDIKGVNIAGCHSLALKRKGKSREKKKLEGKANISIFIATPGTYKNKQEREIFLEFMCS
jgi:hypothetical protein